MARLGDVIEQIRGVSYRPSDLSDKLDDNSVVLLRANNIQNGNLVFDDVVYVSKNRVDEKQYLKKGDILVCTSSGSKELVGKAAIVHTDLPMVFGAFCKVVRPKVECAEYIGHFFQSPYYRNHISAASAGANINNLRNEHIADLQISLPPLDEQRKIVAVLDKVSDLIAKRQGQLDKLDLLVKSRFVEMFGDPVVNPHNLPTVEFGSVLTVKPQNGLYKPQSDYNINGEGTPILRIGGFYDGKVTDFSSLKRLRCSDEELQHYLLRENDIVINRVNSIEYLGKCGLIRGMAESTVYESNMMRLHVDESKFNVRYVVQLLCSQFVYNQILTRAKKSVNQASINQKDVQSLVVYMPSLDVQNKFAAFVEQVENMKSGINVSLLKLETLKKALMQEYFS